MTKNNVSCCHLKPSSDKKCPVGAFLFSFCIVYQFGYLWNHRIRKETRQSGRGKRALERIRFGLEIITCLFYIFCRVCCIAAVIHQIQRPIIRRHHRVIGICAGNPFICARIWRAILVQDILPEHQYFLLTLVFKFFGCAL